MRPIKRAILRNTIRILRDRRNYRPGDGFPGGTRPFFESTSRHCSRVRRTKSINLTTSNHASRESGTSSRTTVLNISSCGNENNVAEKRFIKYALIIEHDKPIANRTRLTRTLQKKNYNKNLVHYFVDRAFDDSTREKRLWPGHGFRGSYRPVVPDQGEFSDD